MGEKGRYPIMGRDITLKEFADKMNIESVTRCADCKHWSTAIAYVSTGKCRKHGIICNRNFYCGDGREKRVYAREGLICNQPPKEV